MEYLDFVKGQKVKQRPGITVHDLACKLLCSMLCKSGYRNAYLVTVR